MAALAPQLKNYQLTTAEILYHLPDFPEILQTFVWQNYDLSPKFPVLERFLDYWADNLDGRLHSVRVACTGIISATDYRYVDGELRLQ